MPSRFATRLPLLAMIPLLGIAGAAGQTVATAGSSATPIAIVPLESATPGGAATVTGALQVTGGRALIAASGAVTAGKANTDVVLPQRGSLRVCASTTVKLAADASVPSGEIPGLMIAFDRGAIETNFSAGTNADTVMTPDFRILIGGPGATRIKIRLADHGDTCVDNPGASAPYVLVTSVFDGSLYRVQPGQRVMLQHGSTHEVVDQEREPCGCPPSEPQGNDFPLAQSAGMAPLAEPKAGPVTSDGKPAVAAPPLVRNANEAAQNPVGAVVAPSSAPAVSVAPKTQPAPKKQGFFGKIGRFFKRIFGAE
ncbi:MAG: hypothetical protein P4L40_16320 [Terracidiphilus sp.]|nr:hypothetical protein [Terracidiphilus sp.]